MCSVIAGLMIVSGLMILFGFWPVALILGGITLLVGIASR